MSFSLKTSGAFRFEIEGADRLGDLYGAFADVFSPIFGGFDVALSLTLEADEEDEDPIPTLEACADPGTLEEILHSKGLKTAIDFFSRLEEIDLTFTLTFKAPVPFNEQLSELGGRVNALSLARDEGLLYLEIDAVALDVFGIHKINYLMDQLEGRLDD